MIKICFLDADTLGDISLEPLNSLGSTLVFGQTNPSETTHRIKDCDVIITNKVYIGRDEMLSNPQLKLICVAATGMNNIDLTAATELGIEVKNVKGYSTNSVGQVTFSLVLTLLNRIPYFDHFVKSGHYSKSPHFSHFGYEFRQLSGMTFGIIGMGAIGQHVANIALAFGCEVIYYSTSGKNHHTRFQSVSLEELLKRADIVSIHAPLNSNTENLLAYKELCLMKPSAILINTGRGGIINENDLAKALDDNLIFGAGIDVFSQEPIRVDHPLLKINTPDKVILTPHIAWASVESREKLLAGICENIKEMIGME